jgi:hypothetical protein
MIYLNIVQFFVYDCLFMDSFQGESRKELKDDNYTEFSRGLSELYQRALLVFQCTVRMMSYVKH